MSRLGVITVLVAWCAMAQPNRDAYRKAYRAWREADPNLERDAASGGAAVAERATRVAADAVNYGVERNAFLQRLTDENLQQLAWLEKAAPVDLSVTLTKGLEEHVAGERAALAQNIQALANDSDKVIQQLRHEMARESAVLTALSGAITERRKAAEAAHDAAVAADQARLKVLEQERDLTAGFKQATEQSSRETAAWVEYYQKLSEAVRGGGTAPAPPVALAPVASYLGAWTFPEARGLYRGTEPEAGDLVVNEDHGHATGTLFVRFKLPPGSTGDPEVRFDFSGDFKNARTQVFNLVTTDGAKGTLELLPGPGPNQLEVNFQTDPRPGKVRQGNFVLIKK